MMNTYVYPFGKDARPSARSVPFALFLLLALTAVLPRPTRAQAEHEHAEAQPHSHGLHFTHPLIAESVSPDTKLRLDYAHRTPTDEGEIEFEGEYAFHRAFSIEVGVPAVSRDFQAGESDFGPEHIHGAFKFANYAFEEQGLLLGYGLGFGIPTGGEEEPHDHAETGHEETTTGGHDHGGIYEVEPFLNAGFMTGGWELVGFAIFSIPTNQAEQHDVGTAFKYNASALYHVTPRVQALLEVNGQTGLSGPTVGRTASYLTPGLRVLPLADSPLAVGVGLSVPLAEERDFDTRAVLSTFYHF